MSTSRIPSPARSHCGKSTPRRYKTKRSRSVSSPVRSEGSIKLTEMISDSFTVSPLSKRRSVLTDNTEIDIPKRQSWWKKLNENSRDMAELLENKNVSESNNAIEENFDVEILSQEKKNNLFDIPESSDGESICSIVIPHHKLFNVKTQDENKPKKKFPLMNNREELVKEQKSYVDHNKEIQVRPKKLFNHNLRTKNKPIFPSTLLNMTTEKSFANKTKDIPVIEPRGQIRNLFGNRPEKRKNMFSNFVVSESENDISDIQPHVFGFPKHIEKKHRASTISQGLASSPTSSNIDIDIDDWKHLPSSTMVDNQLEEFETTPTKHARLTGVATNTTGSANQVNNRKRRTRNESNQIVTSDSKEFIRSNSERFSMKQLRKQSNELVISSDSNKNISQLLESKTNISTGKENAEGHLSNKSKESCANDKKNRSRTKVVDNSQTINSYVNESDAEDDFTLEYENDEENNVINSPELKSSDGNESHHDLNDLHNINATIAQKNYSNIASNSKSIVDNLQNINKPQNKIDISINNLYDKTFQSPKKTNNEKLLSFNETVMPNDSIQLNQENSIDGIASIHNKTVINDTDKTVWPDNRNENNNDEEILNHVNIMHKSSENHASNDRNNSLQECNTTNKSVHNASQSQHNNDEALNNIDKNIQDHINSELEDIESENHYSEIVDDDDTSIHDGDDSKQESTGSVNEHANNESVHDSNGSEVNYAVSEDDLNKNDDDLSENHPSSNDSESETLQINIHDSDIKNLEKEIHGRDVQLKNTDEILGVTVKDSAAMDKEINIHSNYESSRRITKQVNNEEVVEPPESVLYTEPGKFMESFILKDCNSVRKTKSMTTRISLNPSLAHVRESTDLADGTRNSSVDSVWDSHGVTRKTLRQTFGKDFTLRKSLRTLVIEKSAKRETFNPDLINISKYPHANSTELPEKENLEITEDSDNEHHADIDACEKETNELDQESNQKEKQSTRIEEKESNYDAVDKTICKESHEIVEDKEQSISDDEIIYDIRRISNEKSEEISETDVCTNFETAEDIFEGQEILHHEVEEDRDGKELHYEEEEETNHSVTTEVQEDTNDEEEESSNLEDEVDYEEVETNHEEEVTHYEDVNHDEITNYEEEETNSSVAAKVQDDTSDEEENTNPEGEVDYDEAETNHEEEIANYEEDETDHEEETSCEVEPIQENVLEVSKRTRQTTLEMYLRKIKEQDLQRESKIKEDLKSYLKVSRDFNHFKVPSVPMRRKIKTAQIKQKPKSIKTKDKYLPPEMIDDFKYKPPKRLQLGNASWITKRLYKFLEIKLQPKYDYMARVRAEKLVESIYGFTKAIRRYDVAPPDAVDDLKQEMARLKVVDTHHEFYEFFHEYMPREIRVKVVPDIVNKISLPRHGVFTDIIR